MDLIQELDPHQNSAVAISSSVDEFVRALPGFNPRSLYRVEVTLIPNGLDSMIRVIVCDQGRHPAIELFSDEFEFKT